MAWLALFPITSVDAYYHLAVGRWMLDHGEIPDRAVFSATFGDAPWHDNEWGFQILAAALGRAERAPDGTLVLTPFGRAALILARALTLAATLALVSAAMARAGVDPLSRAVGVVLTAFLTFNNLFWTVRPQILTYLGLAALVWIVELDRAGARRALWAFPPLVAVWANVHGAFIVAFVLLGAEAVGSLLDRDGRWRRLASFAAIGLGAACLNPYGWRQIVHPFLYVVRPEIHAGNAEWTRPDFVHLPLFGLVAFATVAAFFAAGRPRWADVLRVAAFVGMLTTAIRHLPLAAIVIVPAFLAAAVRAAGRGGARSHLAPTAPSWGAPSLRALAGAGIVVTCVVLSGARFVGAVPSFTERPVRPMPERAVSRIVSDGVPGTVFNSYRTGGYLMFRLYPQERVFMDGRNDVYGVFREQVYNRILRVEDGWRPLWRDAAERYDVGCVLVDDDAPIARELRTEPGWIERPTGDPGSVLFVRAPRRPGDPS